MDTIDHKLLVEAEKGLFLTPQPFNELAVKIGISPKEVIVRLQKLRENGVIRRFGVSLKPNSIGFCANALVAWKVPEKRISEIGHYFAQQQEISHCYERETVSGKWEYNLYTVIHAHERKAIEELVGKLSSATQLKEYLILYSRRNLKNNNIEGGKKC